MESRCFRIFIGYEEREKRAKTRRLCSVVRVVVGWRYCPIYLVWLGISLTSDDDELASVGRSSSCC